MKYSCRIERLNDKWAIGLIEDLGIRGGTFFHWRHIASRLPMGEKAYKKAMYDYGAQLQSIPQMHKIGMAILASESIAMVFDTEAQAQRAITDILEPQLLAITLTAKGGH